VDAHEFRDFLAAFPAPTPEGAIPDKAGAVKVRLVFAVFDEVQKRKTWPYIGFDFRPVMKNVTDSLNAAVKGVKFVPGTAIDSSRRAVVFAHCVSTRKLLGVGSAASPFEIETHCADREGASVRAITPVGYPVTTVQLDIPKRLVAVQTGRSFSNDPDDRGCRTKMVVEVTGDFEKAYLHWNRFGWHRVTFLGDFKKDVESLAKKIGYTVVHES